MQVARVWVRVLLTCLRLDQCLIHVARVWVRVLLTCLRLDQCLISCPSLGQGTFDLLPEFGSGYF